MKLNSKPREFKDAFTESLMSETASNMNFGAVASGPQSKNKYTPPTIEQVPSIKFHNNSVPMGQSETDTDAPDNLIFPFENIFNELIDMYVRMNEVQEIMISSSELPTLSVVKKNLAETAIKELKFAIDQLKSSIQHVEELTI